MERPTCWLARLAGPVTAIEVTHGADTMAQRCGWVLAMPSANGGVVMSQHAPLSRCDGLNAPRIENATGIGNCHRESDSAVDPPGLSSVYPRGGVGAHGSEARSNPPPGTVLTRGEHF